MPLELKGTIKPGQADTRYYMIRLQVNGRRIVVSSNTRKKDLAIRKEAEVAEAVRQNPLMTQADIVALVRGEGSVSHASALRAEGGLTLKVALDRCLRDLTVWGRIKASLEYGRLARTLEEILGADTPLAMIDGRAVKRVVKVLSEERRLSGATVNRHLAVLRRMFNVIVEQREEDPTSWVGAPLTFPKVKQLKERGAREYFMSPEHEAAIFSAVLGLDEERPGPQGGPPRHLNAYRYHALFLVLVESGLRLSEALKLRWEQLEMPRSSTVGMIKLHTKTELKTGKPRSVPMTEKCREVLDGCKGIAKGPFADLNACRAQHIWKRAKKVAGVTHGDCVIHSLRHTCASRLLRAGVDMMVVKEWLGHSTIVTTQGYLHLATSSLTSAAMNLTQLRNAAAAEASDASI
jgi:integrase